MKKTMKTAKTASAKNAKTAKTAAKTAKQEVVRPQVINAETENVETNELVPIVVRVPKTIRDQFNKFCKMEEKTANDDLRGYIENRLKSDYAAELNKVAEHLEKLHNKYQNV